MNPIKYLNTDLDIASADDLTALAEAFESLGLWTLTEPFRGDDGLWYASFETICLFATPDWKPDSHIGIMLTAIESLGERERNAWDACTGKAFDLGYECGTEPWGFHQEVSNQVLRRIAGVGAVLRLTIYPSVPPKPETAAPQPTKPRRG